MCRPSICQCVGCLHTRFYPHILDVAYQHQSLRERGWTTTPWSTTHSFPCFSRLQAQALKLIRLFKLVLILHHPVGDSTNIFSNKTTTTKNPTTTQREREDKRNCLCRLYGHLNLDCVSLKLARWRPTCPDNRSATYCTCKNYRGKKVDLDGCK